MSNTTYRARNVGDLSWQLHPERPPACRANPTDPVMVRESHHRMFDAAGPGRVSASSWDRIRRARAICYSCPVIAECLEYALEPAHRAEGVWGGMYFPAVDARTRATSREGRRVPQPIPEPA